MVITTTMNSDRIINEIEGPDCFKDVKIIGDALAKKKDSFSSPGVLEKSSNNIQRRHRRWYETADDSPRFVCEDSYF